MLKIIIPLAGSSELFLNAGYFYPKPLIEIRNKLMIEWMLDEPSKIKREHQIIFIIKQEDSDKFHLDNTLKLLSPGSEVIKLKKSAKGGLCSALMAIDSIHGSDSLLILNSDQVIDIDFDAVDVGWVKKNADAGVVTFSSVHPRWSYARMEKDLVIQTAEKNPISRNAIAGYYYFRSASRFFESAFETIKNEVSYEGNFYISSVLNQFVLRGERVLFHSIDPDKYHSFYSPQMIKEFERNHSL